MSTGDEAGPDSWAAWGGGVPDGDGWWPAADDVQAVDAEGRRRLIGTAHVIAGLMTMGLLDHAGGVDGLHEALFPRLEPGPARDRALFTAGAVTGAAAATRKARSKWDPAGLAEIRAALYEAGYEAMAPLAGDAADVAPAWWASWGGPDSTPVVPGPGAGNPVPAGDSGAGGGG